MKRFNIFLIALILILLKMSFSYAVNVNLKLTDQNGTDIPNAKICQAQIGCVNVPSAINLSEGS